MGILFVKMDGKRSGTDQTLRERVSA